MTEAYPNKTQANKAQATANEQRTPKIGLALGGGVARGWAHIGALKRLAELGISPDIVCGTSVGALVGGFWLAGKLDALEDWACSLTKRRMLTYFDVVLNGSGLMGGKRLMKTMSSHLGETTIEELPKKFVAVTAELATGHEIWLQKGKLSSAIQAAYALPGVFPPRAIDDRWVIDGALVNPLPVSVCRAMGARVVIAIGLHANAFGRGANQRRERFAIDDTYTDSLEAPARGGIDTMMVRRLFRTSGTVPGLGATMLASFNIVMDRVTRSRLAGDPADILLMPEVGHIPLLDFDRAEDLIARGAAAVEAQREEIEASLAYLA